MIHIWRRQWHPTPVLLPGKSHGRRGLVGCSPWGRWESDTTERLYFHSSLSYIGEGNGNPLQCSCLENLRDGGAWWAAVYGVTQSRTRLKRLSSSSSMVHICILVTEMKHFNVFVSHLCFLFSEISGFFCPFLIGLFIVSYWFVDLLYITWILTLYHFNVFPYLWLIYDIFRLTKLITINIIECISLFLYYLSLLF